MGSTALTPEYVAANSTGALVPKMSIVAALATALAAFRLGVRLRRKRFGIDDWLIIVSVAFLWALYASCVLTVKYGGLGRHLTVLIKTDPHALDNMEVYFYVGDFVYATSLAIVKCSILVMYWRIFPTRFIKSGTIILSFLVLAWWLGCIFVSIFQCKPIHKAWQPLVKGTCINHNHVFMGKAIPNFTIDFFILCLPIVELMKLNVRKTQKVALGAVFGFGILTCVSSVIRFKIVHTTTNGATDITWVLPDTFLWTVVEVSTAIMSACLPPLGPLLTWVMINSSFIRLSSSGKKESDEHANPNVTTIGGGSGNKKRVMRDPNSLNMTIDSTTGVETPFIQLQAIGTHEGEVARLVPDGYKAERGAQVQGGAPGGFEDVPLNRIAVKTDMSSRESRWDRQA